MKIIALILVCLLALTIGFCAISPGDVDMNGKINVRDCYLVYSGQLNFIQRIIADMNRDGKVDQTDLTQIYRISMTR